MDRARLLEQIMGAENRLQVAYDELERAKTDRGTLHPSNNPHLNQLTAEADAKAAEMRQWFQAASDAYNSGDGEAARYLADQGHAAKGECERLNGQVKAIFAGFEAAKTRVNEARSDIEGIKTELRALREQLALAVRELYHGVSPGGEFLTIKYAGDPHYPKGSYLVSYGERGRGRHVTLIFDPQGNLIAERPSSR